MTYAIVETSGTLLRVEPGRFYDVNRLAVDESGTVILDRVLYVSHKGETMVGQPLVEGAVVSATVMRHLRGRKIIVYKMKPKKKTRKKRGHRQELTRFMVDAISLNGEVLAGEVAAASPLPAASAVAAETVKDESPVAVTQDSEPEETMAAAEVEVEVPETERAVAEPAEDVSVPEAAPAEAAVESEPEAVADQAGAATPGKETEEE
ncbi:MAG: 50S ribosomal protein L21 [Leptolyngbyaceae cyanobacterium]